jgi:hypothetical protein
MFNFKKFIENNDTKFSISEDKKSFLVELKRKYKEQVKNSSLLYQLYDAVTKDLITLPRARAILKQFTLNGYPNQFSDAHKLRTEPNFIPDGRLKVIRKPYLLGKNPDLSSYTQDEDGYYRS